MNLLRQMKRRLFDEVRTSRLVRKFRDLDNFLKNPQIEIGLPPGKDPVLVLAPHPDDECLGCGGTIRQLTKQGVQVDIAFMTWGEKTFGAEAVDGFRMQGIRTRRLKAAVRASRVLGASGVSFLNGVDGELHQRNELHRKVRRLLEAQPYRHVFCPWPSDGHSDHAATFDILRRALTPAFKLDIWLYEVWSPLIANHIVPIDAEMKDKLAALNEYRDQMAGIDYTSMFIGLSRYRSLIAHTGSHAEAFLVLDRHAFARIAHDRG